MKRLVAILVLVATLPLALAAAGCGRKEEGGEAQGPKAVAVEGAPGDAGSVGAPETAVAPEPADVDRAVPASEDAVAVSSTSSLPPAGTKVIQTAYLRLAVPKGRFEEAVDRARAIAAGYGGFVASSTASKGLSERLVRGTLVVRVPAGSYADVVSRLGRLGKVEAREETGQDVSAQFVDLEARARHLQAVEVQLLELLDRADDVSEALAVQQQLKGVQLELEQVRGQLRYLDDQTAYATISLELFERGAVAAAGKDGEGWGVVEAWRDGAEGFVRVAGAVFVGIATAAPVILIAGLALLGARLALVRRRRYRQA